MPGESRRGIRAPLGPGQQLAGECVREAVEGHDFREAESFRGWFEWRGRWIRAGAVGAGRGDGESRRCGALAPQITGAQAFRRLARSSGRNEPGGSSQLR